MHRPICDSADQRELLGLAREKLHSYEGGAACWPERESPPSFAAWSFIRAGRILTRRAPVNPSVAADADGLSRAGLELTQNQDADARQSMEGYFFRDLRPLAEFNSECDPVSSEDPSDR